MGITVRLLLKFILSLHELKNLRREHTPITA